MRYYKTVLLPVQVPVGRYCWRDRICPNFDNKDNIPTCKLGFEIRYNIQGYVPKPKKCLELKEVE